MITHNLFAGPAHVITLKVLARILSLASIGLLLAFIFGEPGRPTPRELALLAFFPFGVIVGMVLGWWRDLVGGAITLVSLAVFYILFAIDRGTVPPGPYFALFASPGIMFLLAGLAERRSLHAART